MIPTSWQQDHRPDPSCVLVNLDRPQRGLSELLPLSWPGPRIPRPLSQSSSFPGGAFWVTLGLWLEADGIPNLNETPHLVI